MKCRILDQNKMGPNVVVIGSLGFEDLTQVVFAQDQAARLLSSRTVNRMEGCHGGAVLWMVTDPQPRPCQR